MEKALIVRTSGSTENAGFTLGESYDLLSESVGGWIECVHFSTLGVDMWLNEEGKLNGLAINPKATALWVSEYGDTDVIVGDVIFTGGVDDEGETLGLSEAQIEELSKFF